jgi:insertion element IS1 protein InsB
MRLLEPFEINIVYSDNNFAYQSRITDSEVVTGKKNTQKIERKHLSLRTWRSRLVRKGIRFSKDPNMHKIVVALVINFWFFQRILW